MKQLTASSRDVTELDIEGYVDDKGIRYLTKATKQPDGTWQCIADVGGNLCRVEIAVTFGSAANEETR